MLTSQISKLGRSGCDSSTPSAGPPSCCFTRWQDGPQPRKHFPPLVQQLYVVGVQSVAIILVSGLFIGMVLSLQGYNVLKDFGAEQSLGPLVSSPCP